MKAKKEVQEIQGTKQEFLKVFREMCYSRSAWQVWADLISMIACSLANSTDPDRPEIPKSESFFHWIYIQKPSFIKNLRR